MTRIHSFDEVQRSFATIKNCQKGFFTNFYPDPFRTELWIKNGEFFLIEQPEAFFFIRNNNDVFFSLFFVSTGIEPIRECLEKVEQIVPKTKVVDLVVGEPENAMLDLFTQMGYKKHSTLVRMSKINRENIVNSMESVMDALSGDIDTIRDYYSKYFDAYTEQIPSKEELLRWLENKSILVYRDNEKIGGFLIYDLLGATLYLRYWFVHPDYRNKKIGGALFREFNLRGQYAKRHLFWVIQDNENAIKRYIHYGFTPEKMYNYVLVKEK